MACKIGLSHEVNTNEGGNFSTVPPLLLLLLSVASLCLDVCFKLQHTHKINSLGGKKKSISKESTGEIIVKCIDQPQSVLW